MRSREDINQEFERKPSVKKSEYNINLTTVPVRFGKVMLIVGRSFRLFSIGSLDLLLSGFPDPSNPLFAGTAGISVS